MSVFYDLGKTPRNVLNQAIVRAIVSESNGALLDPSDMSTLYQDAAGTTPVTAVEQPVGKIIDKSGNGNHATQSVTASRPTLSARYNLGLASNTVMTGYNSWGGGAVGTINSAIAPDGTMTASTVTTQEWMFREGFGGAYGSCSFAIYARAPSGTSFQTSITIWNAGTSTKIASEIITVTDVWQRFTVSGITTAGASLCRVGITNAGGGINPPVGSMWWGYDVRVGADMGPYQRVNTATDYDTDERYFKKYLRFDGIDDYLTLGDVFDIGSEGVSIATSVILFNATKSPIAGKSLAWPTGGRYFLGAEPSAFLFATHGSETPMTIAYSQSIGESVVLSAKLGPHGNRSLSLYKNANLLSTVNTSLTTASYDTTYPFWIGAYPNSSGTTPAYGYLNGGIYSLIITKSALSDAQRIKCERYAASKAGVIL